MILVDTSVWIQHLRHGKDRLANLLDQGQVACHPFVIGELALGSLTRRRAVLELLAELPVTRTVSHEDVLDFIERRGLNGCGIGWVDVHLLASALIDHVPLWTFDRRLGGLPHDTGADWAG